MRFGRFRELWQNHQTSDVGGEVAAFDLN